jgi:hypothetical protein
MPYATRKIASLSSESRFAYYTDATTAVSILSRQEVWMRKASLMNDFSEVRYGHACLDHALAELPGRRLLQLLEGLGEGVSHAFLHQYELGKLPAYQDTYMTCLSEHDVRSEHEIGRLSMWRAYGRRNGVALILSPTALASPSDALRAYSSPVLYASLPAFIREFEQLVRSMEENSALLNSVGTPEVLDWIQVAFRYAALSTKHPGFWEEREWRVLHSPSIEPSERLIKSIESPRGNPQLVYKIPLRNVPDEGLYGLDLSELIDRVIVGPSAHPFETAEVLTGLLQEAGVPSAASRVIISDIPLRDLE